MAEETQPTAAALPKIDLHRHLEGSIRLSTLLETARAGNIELPVEADRLRTMVTLGTGDERAPQALLEKFQVLRKIYYSPEMIRRVIHEAVEDAAADSIIHLELRFSACALAEAMEFSLEDIFDWVMEAARQAADQYPLSLCLIASVNRHEPVAVAEKIARLTVDHGGGYLAGLDLAGDEESFMADPFLSIFNDVGKSGIKTVVHAGEWSGPESIRQALEEFKADRIGHGVRIVESTDVLTLARERNIPFEVCVGSNILSGIAGSYSDHPITEMVQSGLRVTLNTDNPSIQGCTLSGEVQNVLDNTDFSLETIKALQLNAAQVSFLSKKKKKELENQLLEAYRMGL